MFVDFDALAQHRAANVNMGYRGRPQGKRPAARSEFDQAISIPRGRADEAALNIRAQRQMRELEIAERIGALTPTREVRDAAAEAVSALRNAFALSLNDFGRRSRQRLQPGAAARSPLSEGVREEWARRVRARSCRERLRRRARAGKGPAPDARADA